jgi:hypothetical protein
VSGGLLSTLPLELRLRGKSTTQSHRAPIYYVDLTVNGHDDCRGHCQRQGRRRVRKAAGFDQMALDEAARQGFANGAFEESEEDGAAVVEEFFPDEFDGEPPATHKSSGIKPGLAAKLNQKAERLKGNGASMPVTLEDHVAASWAELTASVENHHQTQPTRRVRVFFQHIQGEQDEQKSSKTEIVIPTWEGHTGPRYWGDHDYGSHDNQTSSFWVSLRGVVPGDPYSYMTEECRAIGDMGLYVWIEIDGTVSIDVAPARRGFLDLA